MDAKRALKIRRGAQCRATIDELDKASDIATQALEAWAWVERMDLNKQPADITEALALASQWNFKHVARIAQLETELAEARKDNEELDGTDAAHSAWWRGNNAGVAQVCAKINAILDGADVFGTAAEPWESTRRRVAEARKDSERLEWAWANPDKFAEAQRSTPPNRTGRQQMDAARGAK